MIYKQIILLFILFSFLPLAATKVSALDPSSPDMKYLQYLMYRAKNAKNVPLPAEYIIRENMLLFCTGQDRPAIENNRGANLIKVGKFKEARDVFELALKKSPLFFPYRYNLGLCYYHLKDIRRAMLHLKKASQIVPEYYLTYVQIGYVYELDGDSDRAGTFYKKAIKLNPGYLNTFILLGDIYFNRGQLEAAEKFYSASLKVAPYFINGQLGRAKVLFKQRKYYKVYVLLKVIDLTGDYDKSLHFYYAEAAYKLQKYQVAYDQYTTLLKFKGDRFFIKQSISLIRYKRDLASRFAEEVSEIE